MYNAYYMYVMLNYIYKMGGVQYAYLYSETIYFIDRIRLYNGPLELTACL